MIKSISLLFAVILLILIAFAGIKTHGKLSGDPAEITGTGLASANYQPWAIVIAARFLLFFLKNLLKGNAIR